MEPRCDLAALVGRRSSAVDDDAVALLEAELAASARTVFLIGDGAAEAVDALMALVELTGARFITTPDGKGLVDPHHPAYQGVFGFGGHPSAQRALDQRPLVIAFGTGLGEFASGGWSSSLLNDRLIHVDESEENLMRSPVARLHVRGDLRAVCQRLLDRWRGRGEAIRTRPAGDDDGLPLHSSDDGLDDAPIKPQRLMKTLSERCPPRTRFLVDAGNSLSWAIHHLAPAVGATAGWLRMALDYAPMGWAIGAAIGVARGNPGTPVACITGDGAYLMSGQEITVAAEERLPVVFVILNDHAYGMVMHGQRLARAEPIAYELWPVDFRGMAQAMGLRGHVIEAPEDLERLDFAELFAGSGPTVLDVRIDREEVPPMMVRMKTLGSVKAVTR
jgi:acetolactate synthase-1/2/3 large subunit